MKTCYEKEKLPLPSISDIIKSWRHVLRSIVLSASCHCARSGLNDAPHNKNAMNPNCKQITKDRIQVASALKWLCPVLILFLSLVFFLFFFLCFFSSFQVHFTFHDFLSIFFHFVRAAMPIACSSLVQLVLSLLSRRLHDVVDAIFYLYNDLYSQIGKK